jgi:hypothetical protein
VPKQGGRGQSSGLRERYSAFSRVRDKIAASKRKGLWVGGPVPLGYRCIDKKLEIVPEEAPSVRRRANGTSACSPPLPSCRLASLRRLSMAPHPADLTVTGLAKALSYSWGEQERRVGCDVAPATNAGVIDSAKMRPCAYESALSKPIPSDARPRFVAAVSRV